MQAAPDVWRRLEHVLRSVLPELGALPVYLLDSQAFPGGMGDCDGCTARNLDLASRPAIGSAWRGRGPAIGLDDAHLLAHEEAWNVETVLLCWALHEAGHVAAEGWLPDFVDRTGDTPLEILATEITRASLTVALAPLDICSAWLADYLHHGPDWTRTTLHLAHRASAMGLYVPLARVMGRPDRSRPEWYREALGDELERLDGIPVADILRTPAPTAFTKLWRADLDEYMIHLNRRKAEMTNSILQRITSAITGRRAEAHDTFLGLVQTIADGIEPDIDITDEVLLGSGKSTQDLADAVAALVHRKELAADLAAAEGIDAQVAEVTAAIAAAQQDLNEAIEEAQRRHREATADYKLQADRLRAIRKASVVAAVELERSASPELRSKLDDLLRRRGTLQAERSTQGSILGDKRSSLVMARHRQNDAQQRVVFQLGKPAKEEVETAQIEVNGLVGDVERLTAKVAEQDRLLGLLAREIASVRAEMHKP